MLARARKGPLAAAKNVRQALRFARWVAVIVPAAMVTVGGWFHRWVADDAYIDFRVVGNLVAGHGPVFNVGERVEAYTDPLWVAVLTVARVVLGPSALPWCAVCLGLLFTATGVLLGGRAAQQVAHSRGVVIPLGLVAVCALDAMWDFATSGLETGMIFAWEGLSWWLLVRVAHRHRGACMPGAIIGLGVLIRPELALVSAVFLGSLALLICLSSWDGTPGLWHRWIAPLLAAGTLPVIYQLWRMTYFALLVPNTALAKSAGSAQWSRGAAYLEDLADPSWLWVPMTVIAIAWVLHLRSLRSQQERELVIVLAAPMLAALLDALYVMRVGGDFMHARMLLPALFLAAMTLYCELRSALEVIAGVVVAGWALTVAVGYRYHSPSVPLAQLSIVNEREFWVGDSGNPHPVSLSEYHHGLFASIGQVARSSLALAPPPGSRQYLVLLSLTPHLGGATLPGRGTLPVRVVAPEGSIGLTGVVAGPLVYIFDGESLANPIGSHFQVDGTGRAGHGKPVSSVWMLGRFVAAGTPLPANLNPQAVTDARAALRCGELARYTQAITRPLTFAGAWSNFVHATGYTTMSFSSDPAKARRQLCDS